MCLVGQLPDVVSIDIIPLFLVAIFSLNNRIGKRKEIKNFS